MTTEVQMQKKKKNPAFIIFKKFKFLKPNVNFQGLIHDCECLTLEALASLFMIHWEITEL